MVFSKTRDEAEKENRTETMHMVLFSDWGIKGSQIMDPIGTTETEEKGVETEAGPLYNYDNYDPKQNPGSRKETQQVE